MTECNKSVYLANKSIDIIDAVNKGYTEGYNKALEEAICKVEEHKTKGYVTGITNNPFEFGACQMADDIVKILKRLKAGGENGV